MNTRRLISQTVYRYKSFYRLIATAVVVAVAVITGSLAVGDSVRTTLVKRVEERLGNTETIIFSRYSYLSDEVVRNLSGEGHSADEVAHHLKAQYTAYLHLNGFVSISGNLIPVMVWGSDDKGVERGEAKINQTLYNEIKSAQSAKSPLPKEIVLRLPTAGMVPIGSMYVTDSYTTSLRLSFSSVLREEEDGNLNLRNEQMLPLNIFVNREELAEALGVSGKINVILSNKITSMEEFSAAWSWAHSGLQVKSDTQGGQPAFTVTSERIFIQNQVVEALCKTETTLPTEVAHANRFYAYLANAIRKDNLSIPYSFITAIDHYNGYPIPPNEIILTDYAARRLNVRLHDTLSIRYFISRQFKTLREDSLLLTVGKIVPLYEVQANPLLRADFPGLSNAARCTDWDSDLPINMNLITDEDEAYWTMYKNTPKALLPYSAMAPRWENAFGNATALQIYTQENQLNRLTPDIFDIQLVYPREAAIVAARSGVDFSSLFLSLAIFIIVSAALLMVVPLSEMLWVRRHEVDVLKAIGFSNRRITQLLRRETLPVVLLSALTGVIVGLIYTYFTLLLLGSVWKGATHTQGFGLYPNPITITIGVVAGVVLSLSLLFVVLRKAPRYTKSKGI